MIYLIEGVFPDGYFGKCLSGLRTDMAVVNDLISRLLPSLTEHMTGLSLENELLTQFDPPLVDMYTLQWFVTLFTNCLPRKLVLRVWDLLLIEGDEILIRTALAIWELLGEKIRFIDSAEDFCSILSVLVKELRELDDEQSDHLVDNMLSMTAFPFPRLSELRAENRLDTADHNSGSRKRSLVPAHETRRTSYISMVAD